MKKWLIASGMTLLAMTSAVFAAGDAEKGKMAYAVCLACHGANGEGNKALNSPAIAGQEDWYLIRQLKNYKDGIRGTDPKDTYGMQMRPMAMTLADDAAIENMAAYVASLPAKKPAETIKGDAEKGKTSYAVCIACHGANAEGNKALNAPKLTGLQDWYMERQLKNYKDGIRGSNPKDIYGMQMKPMASVLADDQAIKDVLAYINSLQK